MTTQIATQAQITVTSAPSVYEGQFAIAGYALSAALPDAAEITASIHGFGAEAGTDYTGFKYRLQGQTDWSVVSLDGKIIIPAGITGFELQTNVASDS